MTKVNTKDLNRAGNKQGLLLRGCDSFAQCKQRLTTMAALFAPVYSTYLWETQRTALPLLLLAESARPQMISLNHIGIDAVSRIQILQALGP